MEHKTKLLRFFAWINEIIPYAHARLRLIGAEKEEILLSFMPRQSNADRITITAYLRQRESDASTKDLQFQIVKWNS